MKHTKKLFALLLAVLMIAALAAPAYADVTNDGKTHVITIDNTDQAVSHTYTAYQVFKGDLDAAQQKLANIQWGNGVDAAKLVKALQETTDTQLAGVKTAVTGIDTTDDAAVAAAAKTVADAISGFTSTSGLDVAAGAIDAFATVVGDCLATGTAFTEGTGENAGKYTATVPSDGYYFIKDSTADNALQDETTKKSDTRSKYIIAITQDTTLQAKDTTITPDKKIVGATENVAADSAAIGDTQQFVVTIEVPNTKKFEDHFVFKMNDKLPAGMTFLSLDSIKINSTDLPVANYALTVNEADDETAFTALTGTDAAVQAVTTTGGQNIHIQFKDFKNYVETNSLIGKTIEIKYSAVVNKDATYGPTANENEVKFDYSNDPNHDYTGDDFKTDEPKGTTPESKTRTYVLQLELYKKDGKTNTALSGAEFQLTGDAIKTVLETGTKFVATDYVAQAGETLDTTTKYYKLVDGSYTTTAPVDATSTQYVKESGAYVEAYLLTYNKAVVTPGGTVDTKLITTAEGYLDYQGLNAGDYTLTETVAPDGYNKLTDPITIKLAWMDPEAITEEQAAAEPYKTAKANGGFYLDAGTDEIVDMGTATKIGDSQSKASVVLTVENFSGTQLPSTGGIGTTIFYVVGGLLVAAAVVLLITKKRVREEN